VAGADPHFEGFARLNSVDPALSQNASMKEGVPGPIGEVNEAKAFLQVEPFDDATDRWTGGYLEGRSAKAGSGAECTRLGVEGVSVELATPRVTEILMSHWLPNFRVALGQFGRDRNALLCGSPKLSRVDGDPKLAGERRCSS